MSADDTAENSGIGKPFKPGQSGNPKGRPKGSRSKLSEAFLGKLLEDFNAHGEEAIATLRATDPKAYLQTIAIVTAKLPVAEVSVSNTLVDQRRVMVVTDHGTDEEWEAKLRQQQRRLTEEDVTIPNVAFSEK